MDRAAGQDLDRVRELFALLVDAPASHRLDELNRLCPDDPALRDEVVALLGHHDPASSFLEFPAIADALLLDDEHAVTPVGAFEPGQRIGGFTIERVIGAGGMGMVYAARQHEPNRLVALKVMRPGLASQSSLRRFAQEGAALARLTHPGIAPVFAAGVDRSPAGVLHPYLALEFIDGLPLDRHLAQVPLRIAERIALFLRIVDAMTHAHQRGVVHRDLKPANILVTREGSPRILDFGVARLLDHSSGEPGPTRLTHAGQLAGTLAYMSPEQLEGDPDRVDIRTDVYSLGVVLYETLAGRLPIDTAGSSLERAAATIRTVEPVRLGQIDRALRGDLEVIVARALEKDRDRRYPSAADFGEDLRRWQRHEPILARPASTGYRVRKFVRRHHVLVGAAGAIMLAMTIGLLATLWQARIADRARAEAVRREAVAVETNAFLRDLFLAVDRAKLRGEEPTLRDAVNDAVQRLERHPPESPLVEADVRGTIGRIHAMLGEIPQALAQQQRALSLLDTSLGPDAPESAVAAAVLASTLAVHQQYEAAEMLVRERLTLLPRSPALEGPRSRLLSMLSVLADDLSEAMDAAEEAADLSVRAYGPEHEYTLAALSNLARVTASTGDWTEAEEIARRCLSIRTRRLSPAHPDALLSAEDLAAVVRKQGRVEESAAIMEQVVAMGDRVLPVEHPEQVENRLSAASVLYRAGDMDRAAVLLESALPLAMRDGRHTPNSVRCLGFLCTLRAKQERYHEAEELAARTVAAAEACYGAGGPGEDAPDGVIQSWTVYYNLYDRWNRIELRDEWAAKMAATRTGAAILRMSGHQESNADHTPGQP